MAETFTATRKVQRTSRAAPWPSEATLLPPATSDRFDWRAGLEEWRSREKGQGNLLPRLRTAQGTGGSLTPIRTISRRSAKPVPTPQTRRSKSAEPGSLFQAHIETFAAERARQKTAGSSRLSTTTSVVDFRDLDRPRSRTRVLPLVANRIDRNQVADFYSELREAKNAGKQKFEGGIEDRKQLRVAAKAKASRVRIVGDEVLEPMTHADFMDAVESLLKDLKQMELDYDSDDVDGDRIELFERTREKWHIARGIVPEKETSNPRHTAHAHEPSSQRHHDEPPCAELERTEGRVGQSEMAGVSREEPSKKASNGEKMGSEPSESKPLSPQKDDEQQLKRKIASTKHETAELSRIVNPEAMKQHARALEAFERLGLEPHAKTVCLKGRKDVTAQIHLEAIKEIFEEVKGLVPPNELDISDCTLGGIGMDIVASSLSTCCTLKSLDLSHNNLCSRSAVTLSAVLRDLTRLEALIVDDNEIGPRGAQALMSSCRGALSLRAISMSRCDVECQGASYISQALHPAYWNTFVRDELVVEKRKSQLSAFGAAAQGAGFPDFFLGTCLTSLKLRDNKIGPDGSVTLLKSMAMFCSNLKHLDLSLNHITAGGQDNRGATELCETLKVATSLVTLDLSDCKLQSEGGALVVAGLMDKTRHMQREIKELWQLIGRTPDSHISKREELEKKVVEKENIFHKYIMTRDLKCLKIPRNNFGPSGIMALGEARNLYPSLTEFDIGSNEVTGNRFNTTFDAAINLSNSLKTSNKLQILILRDNGLGAPSLESPNLFPALTEISTALTRVKLLTRLDLAKNNIGVHGAQAIANSLDVLHKLMYLDLSSNAVGSEGMKILAPSFRPKLVEINLSDNDIGPDGTNSLASKVPTLTNLTKLDLSGNRMTKALKQRLFNAKGEAKFLLSQVAKDIAGDGGLGEAKKQLLMAGGDATKRGLVGLAAACGEHLLELKEVIVCKKIQVSEIRNAQPSLDLSGVEFDLQDIAFVTEVLKYNKSVTSVDLANNNLNAGGQIISEWMKGAHQLRQLNLSDVNLSDVGAEKIAVGLTPLYNLTSLNLSNNNIGTDGIKFLSPALEALSELLSLDFSRNPLTIRHTVHSKGENYYTAGVIGLAESLEHCIKLESLNLSCCKLGDEGAVAVANALQMLTALHKVDLQENHIEHNGQVVVGHALRSCRAMTITDNIRSDEILDGLHLKVHAIYQVSFIANCIRRDYVSKIDLSNNRLGRSSETLEDLMEGLGKVRNLTDLNLSGNKPFSDKVSQTLAASLRHMTSLRRLCLANNGIFGGGADAIACTLVRLFQIEVIDLSKNRFTSFPVALSLSCPILWKMDLTENPWKTPSADLMKKNSTQIRDTLNSEFLNGTIDQEIGLIFIGEVEVGKTSIVNALTGEDNRSPHVGLEDRTHCIEMFTWKPMQSRTTPLYNIYDFSGCKVYEPIHMNLCLLRRALYCLVWRPFPRLQNNEVTSSASALHKEVEADREPLYRVRGHGLCTKAQVIPHLRKQVNPFVDKLYRRVPGFYFLLIATHADCITEVDMEWQAQEVKEALTTQLCALRERFSYITAPKMLAEGNTMFVSTTIGTNMDSLQDVLLKETYKLPFYGEILPETWRKARHSISQIRNMHRAVLRARKKEAKHEGDHPLLDGSDAKQALDKTVVSSHMHSDSSDAEESDQSDEAPVQMFKIWQTFAMRSMLRVRLKRMMAVTPEMAKGFMWIGHFKNLLKRAGVEQSQYLSVMRYFHDSGWIRCYGFDDSKLTKLRSNEHEEGFEMLDPFRSACFKLATNSHSILHRKDSDERPHRIPEEAWIDMCDTVFLDMNWLFEMTSSIVSHDGTHNILQQTSPQLRQEALDLYTKGQLKWAPGTPCLLTKLWRRFLSEYEFRKVLHVLRAKDLLLESSTKAVLRVPVLEKAISLACINRVESTESENPTTETFLTHQWPGSNPEQVQGRPNDKDTPMQSPMQSLRKNTSKFPLIPENSECFVFFSHERSGDTANKDLNFATCIVPILRHTVEKFASASVLDCADYATEEELEGALRKCSVFIVCASDTYMRSKTGRHQMFYALDLGLHIIAVIMPNYTNWPPSLKDGCWWDFGNNNPVANFLYLATLVDLSVGHYRVYLDILAQLQEAQADGDIDPIDTETMWNSLRNGEYDEEDPDLQDEVAVESEMLHLSKGSILEFRKFCLSSFVQAVESVGMRVLQLFNRRSCFVPELCVDELKSRHGISKRIIKRYERASAKMEEMHQQEEVMREQMELARLQEENSRQRKAEEEHQRMKKKAELWHTDPLHAKIALLKDIANVTPGIEEMPKWHQKEEILEQAQAMAELVFQEQREREHLAALAAAHQDEDGEPASEKDTAAAIDSDLQELGNLDEKLEALAADAAELVGSTSLEAPGEHGSGEEAEKGIGCIDSSVSMASPGSKSMSRVDSNISMARSVTAPEGNNDDLEMQTISDESLAFFDLVGRPPAETPDPELGGGKGKIARNLFGTSLVHGLTLGQRQRETALAQAPPPPDDELKRQLRFKDEKHAGPRIFD